MAVLAALVTLAEKLTVADVLPASGTMSRASKLSSSRSRRMESQYQQSEANVGASQSKVNRKVRVGGGAGHCPEDAGVLACGSTYVVKSGLHDMHSSVNSLVFFLSSRMFIYIYMAVSSEANRVVSSRTLFCLSSSLFIENHNQTHINVA